VSPWERAALAGCKVFAKTAVCHVTGTEGDSLRRTRGLFMSGSVSYPHQSINRWKRVVISNQRAYQGIHLQAVTTVSVLRRRRLEFCFDRSTLEEDTTFLRNVGKKLTQRHGVTLQKT